MIGKEHGQQGEERRRSARLRTQLGALVIPSDGAPRRGRVDNVSEAGLWIDTPDPLPVGARCTVAVEFGDERWPLRSLAGRVVRSERRGFALACFLDQRTEAAELYERVRAGQVAAARPLGLGTKAG